MPNPRNNGMSVFVQAPKTVSDKLAGRLISFVLFIFILRYTAGYYVCGTENKRKIFSFLYFK
jgi:hypothetical protein